MTVSWDRMRCNLRQRCGGGPAVSRLEPPYNFSRRKNSVILRWIPSRPFHTLGADLTDEILFCLSTWSKEMVLRCRQVCWTFYWFQHSGFRTVASVAEKDSSVNSENCPRRSGICQEDSHSRMWLASIRSLDLLADLNAFESRTQDRGLWKLSPQTSWKLSRARPHCCINLVASVCKDWLCDGIELNQETEDQSHIKIRSTWVSHHITPRIWPQCTVNSMHARWPSPKPSNRVIIVEESNISRPLRVPPHKVLIPRRPLALGVARQHALYTHANTLDVLNRTPTLTAQ